MRVISRTGITVKRLPRFYALLFYRIEMRGLVNVESCRIEVSNGNDKNMFHYLQSLWVEAMLMRILILQILLKSNTMPFSQFQLYLMCCLQYIAVT